MDSKGTVAEVSYPNIVFSIDNFEDIFSDIYTTKEGQKVAVQLMACNEVRRMVLTLSLSIYLSLSHTHTQTTFICSFSKYLWTSWYFLERSTMSL